MNVREHLEERERQFLSPYAARSAETRGRVRPEPEHEYRTAYQRDRDRIVHTKAFRRLKRKTQVFLAPEDDHYRTRLTHTLEVSQIARTAARALFLNEDLAEAIALGHDLGHTPFGHAGEAVLDELAPGGFHHARQSLRLVDLLESTRHGPGLNLTAEVRDGIANHSLSKCIITGLEGQRAMTLEGDIVGVCDAIAYVNHDIDDAIRAGVITLADLPQEALRIVGKSTSERINTMVTALIEGSHSGQIAMAEEVRQATCSLRSYLYDSVYPGKAIRYEIDKSKRLLRDLFEHFVRHPDQLPPPSDSADSPERRAVDMIAGMTDQYALRLYRSLFFPESWHR